MSVVKKVRAAAKKTVAAVKDKAPGVGKKAATKAPVKKSPLK